MPGTARDRFRRLLRNTIGAAAFVGGAHLALAIPHWALRTRRRPHALRIAGVAKFDRVTGRLWRSAAPTTAGYRRLAAAGVRTVIDLRAEVDETAAEPARAAGLAWIHLPIRDGQVPSRETLRHVCGILDGSTDPVLLHCSAGVGRTGSVVAALRVRAGRRRRAALAEAWHFGPLTLEQVVAILLPNPGRVTRTLVVTASRVVDAPRRAWSRLRARWRRRRSAAQIAERSTSSARTAEPGADRKSVV